MSEQRRLSSFASGAHTFFKCFICQRLIWHRNETSYYPQFFFRFICSLSLAFSFLSHFQFNVIVGQFVVVAWESRERQTENEGTSKRNEKRVVAVISSQLTFQEDEQNEKIDFDSFDLELNVTAFSDEIFFFYSFFHWQTSTTHRFGQMNFRHHFWHSSQIIVVYLHSHHHDRLDNAK